MNLHALEDAVNALVRLADATERLAKAVESLDGKTAQVKAIDYTPRGGEADA